MVRECVDCRLGRDGKSAEQLNVAGADHYRGATCKEHGWMGGCRIPILGGK